MIQLEMYYYNTTRVPSSYIFIDPRVKIPRRSLYEPATYLTIFHGSQADKVVLSFRASFVNTLIRRWDSSFSSTNSNNPVYGDISYERR